MIVLLIGLPGTGKSTMAGELTRRLDAAVLNKDVIRAALFPGGLVEYSIEQDDFVMSAMAAVAEWILEKHPWRIVVFDGRTFSREYQRAFVFGTAAKMKQTVRVIETVAPREIARARLEADRAAGTHPAANRDWALYEKVAKEFDPVAEPKLVVDTNGAVDEWIGPALAWLTGGRAAEEVRRDNG